MQVLFTEALILIVFAIGVGTLSSMLGIGGGIINTPLLIIVFGLLALNAPVAALIAAFFVAVASTVAYWRQEPKPISVKIGLFLAITTIPGSMIGVALRTLITDDYILRLVFGITMFPIALKMLFAKKGGKGDFASEIAAFNFSQLSRGRLTIALLGGFVGGVAAGLLGIGGGAIVVPVLCVLLGLPMHIAVATSMFIMMFTAAAGTTMNYFLLGPETFHVLLLYGLSLGIGMIIGGQIGPRLARKINAVQLKQIFGLILVFPIAKMMKLGQIWLDPMGESFLVAILGDLIIWLAIVLPIGLLRLVQIRKQIPNSTG
ncbi:MAG: sulfite exporter TauE/SafE family protein [Candidatus Thorarchaeota archaeon]